MFALAVTREYLFVCFEWKKWKRSHNVVLELRTPPLPAPFWYNCISGVHFKLKLKLMIVFLLSSACRSPWDRSKGHEMHFNHFLSITSFIMSIITQLLWVLLGRRHLASYYVMRCDGWWEERKRNPSNSKRCVNILYIQTYYIFFPAH